ncbi:uncharacterized protein TNCV_1382731 [Trichonephila clavipes]|nr:uncharacterized protein TNCV_1382731 [Trichonephila clavipes]
MKDGDIMVFLTLFERQTKIVGIEKRHWVSALLALRPSEINQLMAREAEEKFDDYDYIKDLFLKPFKLSAEIFRQKFVKHQRNPAQSWRDFVFEITSYLEEWLEGLGLVDIKCGQTSIKAVIDAGVQISVLREDLIDKGCGEGEGTIQIISAFGENEIAALKLFNLKIDDGKHGSVPIMCAVSKKLVNDMLISATAYEIMLENVQLFDFENQRDFEGTKDKDIQLEREEKLSALALGQETDTSEKKWRNHLLLNFKEWTSH